MIRTCYERLNFGVPGTFVSCYLQMFYVTFIFPWILMCIEKHDVC